MRILIFGASVTQGLWDSEGGWAQRLKKSYDKKSLESLKKGEHATIFNLGVSGDTAKDVLNRFQDETKARIWPGEEFVFVFSVGTNNTAVESNGRQFSTIAEYKKDIQKIVEKAKEFSEKIMFVGLPPCDEAETTPMFDEDINFTNTRILEFDKIMRQVAYENKLPHVRIFEEMKKQIDDGKDLLADGLHPNTAGHELIASLVKPVLDKLVEP